MYQLMNSKDKQANKKNKRTKKRTKKNLFFLY